MSPLLFECGDGISSVLPIRLPLPFGCEDFLLRMLPLVAAAAKLEPRDAPESSVSVVRRPTPRPPFMLLDPEGPRVAEMAFSSLFLRQRMITTARMMRSRMPRTAEMATTMGLRPLRAAGEVSIGL